MTKIEGEPLLIDDLIARRTELQSELRDTAASSSEQARKLVSRAVSRFLSFGYLLKQYLSRAPLGGMLASASRRYQKEAESLGNPSDRRKFERAGGARCHAAANRCSDSVAPDLETLAGASRDIHVTNAGADGCSHRAGHLFRLNDQVVLEADNDRRARSHELHEFNELSRIIRVRFVEFVAGP